MCAEYSVCVLVSKYLYKTFRVVVGLGPTVCRHRELTDFVLHVLYSNQDGTASQVNEWTVTS